MTFGKLKAAVLFLGWVMAGQAAAAPIDDAALRRVAERGHEIFLLDEAAWVSTDEMLRKLPDPRKAGVSGWIVERNADYLRSIFYALRDQRPVAVFIVDTRGREVISSRVGGGGEADRLTDVEVLMIRAREVAARQPIMRCTEGPPNTVVIPPASTDEPVEVYVLSAQIKTGEYPMGGHQLFRIDPQGQVVSQRKFTNSCLNMSRPANTASLFVTHLLDATPTEIHVFTSETVRMRIFVASPVTLPPDPKHYRIWQVDGDKITLSKDVSQ